ncbi:archaeal proteasome endopeptidase complex subunit beta [Candidatus Bathyarchaeota archaeon]|nr:MAG: archaeal proteasome endopeptidase complex subunit beta [Candidatus Bathyarchaeota archaeon]
MFDGLSETKRYILHGTTTVGLRCKDGIVMATDTRATAFPGLVAHKNVKKIYEITWNVGMTIAGVPAEALNVLDILRANARLYVMERRRLIPVRAVASLASNILFSWRYYPYLIQVIIGGFDDEGYHLYSLDPLGSIIEDDVISTGSGSTIAYGVLEDVYDRDVSLEDGVSLAMRAVLAAIKRDVYTGNDVNVATITRNEGYKEFGLEEKKRLLSEISSRKI